MIGIRHRNSFVTGTKDDHPCAELVQVSIFVKRVRSSCENHDRYVAQSSNSLQTYLVLLGIRFLIDLMHQNDSAEIARSSAAALMTSSLWTRLNPWRKKANAIFRVFDLLI